MRILCLGSSAKYSCRPCVWQRPMHVCMGVAKGENSVEEQIRCGGSIISMLLISWSHFHVRKAIEVAA